MKKIALLSLGGTFERVYSTGAGARGLKFPDKSAARSICETLNLAVEVLIGYDPRAARDDLDMTDDDREQFVLWCRRADVHMPIVIIHGTDTMIQSARALSLNEYLQKSGRVIILTGAYKPACMKDSDAEFNLGGAIIAAQTCKPGIYIVMSGYCYEWNKCQQNPTTGVFEPI